MDVSIVIVNWNTRDILRDCLRSVYEQTQDISFEVIVVDNSSSDGSAAMVRKEFPQLILIENAENRGFATANNQGMAIAKGRYVLLLNPDTVVLDSTIQKSVLFADQNPSAAVIGVRIERPDGTLCRDCFRYASPLNLIISTFGMNRLFPNSRFWGRERYSWWDYQSVCEVEVVAGCYMLVRRTAVDQVGSLDESYFMYGEEMDWCWRFQKSGWKILYFPDVRIIHYGGVSVAQNSVEMSLEFQKSLLRFIEKKHSKMTRYLVETLLFGGGIVRVFYWTTCWLVSSKGKRKQVKTKIREAFVKICWIFTRD